MICYTCNGQRVESDSQNQWEEFICEACHRERSLHVPSGHSIYPWRPAKLYAWPALSIFASTVHYWKWVQEHIVGKWMAVSLLLGVASTLEIWGGHFSFACSLCTGFAISRARGGQEESKPKTQLGAILMDSIIWLAIVSASVSAFGAVAFLLLRAKVELLTSCLEVVGYMFFLSDSYPRKPIRVWKLAPSVK